MPGQFDAGFVDRDIWRAEVIHRRCDSPHCVVLGRHVAFHRDGSRQPGGRSGLSLALAAIVPLVDLLPSGVNPWDSSLFFATGLLLLSTGAIAAWIPARRAAKIDPAAALRQD